jgi:hypothetical protein
LAFVQELDLESIISANDDAEKRRALEREIAAIRGELSSVTDLMEKTYAMLNAGGPPEFVANKLTELSSKQTILSNHLDAKEMDIQHFNARESRFYDSKEEIKSLVKKLQAPVSDELYKLRAQIASRLKVLVKTLLIAPRGNAPITQKSIEHLRSNGGADWDVIAHMEEVAAQSHQSRRYFAVGFRDAAVRAVFPRYGDPLRYEQQIVSSPGKRITIELESGNDEESIEYFSRVPLINLDDL